MRVRFLLGLLLAGCGAPIAAVDSGLPDDLQSDAGTTDAGVPDAGGIDAGVIDAGGFDAGVTDGGPGDAGTIDAGGDAGAIDAGIPDAGIADAGPSCSRCLNYGSESNVGTVATTALTEISGLAASHVHPNVVYAHNDSGGLRAPWRRRSAFGMTRFQWRSRSPRGARFPEQVSKRGVRWPMSWPTCRPPMTHAASNAPESWLASS